MKRRVSDPKWKAHGALATVEWDKENWVELTCPLRGKMPIILGKGSVRCLSNILEKLQPDNLFVISDQTVYGLHAGALLENLPLRQEVREILLQPGEMHKNLESLERVCERLFATGATRQSVILNFGGGVVLNLGGLAASLIYRGVRFIQIPTTLLAQSDVIVSNKQTINFARGKNRLGVFNTPELSLVDPQWLMTEPENQLQGALVEYCKNAIILGEAHYDRAVGMISNYRKDPEVLRTIVEDSLKQKFEIAEMDPAEKKDALILEYGHTVGHALEYLSEGRLQHGEAVYHGMRVAGALSHAMGLLPEEDLRKQNDLLALLQGIASVPRDISVEQVMDAVARDNKRSGQSLKFILLSSIGKAVRRDGSYLTSVEAADLQEVLERELFFEEASKS